MANSERNTPGPKRDVNGIFNIDKPPGMTSHDVVARVRRISGQRKAGHAGTLDPMATGVLPVVLGKATRLVEYLADADKAYRAVLVLGATSDTYDREGNITPTPDAIMPSQQQVEEALERFRGEIEQLPPMHSAIKVGGKKLYELARAGVEVERQTRRVTIKKLELEVFNPPALQVFVECSKGTYIRSLAHDLGSVLGTGAYLQDLTRTRHGPFSIEGAITLEGLQAAFEEDTWREALYPPEYILRGWHTHTTTPEEELAIRQGKTLRLPTPAEGEREMMATNTANGELLAVLYWDGERGVWQPRKVFGNTAQPEQAKGPVQKLDSWEKIYVFITQLTNEAILNVLQDKSVSARRLYPTNSLHLLSRLTAINRLVDLRVLEALDPLRKIYADKAEPVQLRERAIEALLTLAPDQTIETIIEALQDASARVRRQAIWSLEMLGDERALRALLDYRLHNAHEEQDRQLADRAIETIRSQGDLQGGSQ